jgi:hypothetical protein
MENQHEAGPLPEKIINEARRLGLGIEGNEIMFESAIGGGIFVNNWMAHRDGGIRLEVRIIGETADNPQEYEELMPGARSETIDEGRAMAVVERWGILQGLETRFDAQQIREKKEREERRAAFGGNSNRE